MRYLYRATSYSPPAHAPCAFGCVMPAPIEHIGAKHVSQPCHGALLVFLGSSHRPFDNMQVLSQVTVPTPTRHAAMHAYRQWGNPFTHGSKHTVQAPDSASTPERLFVGGRTCSQGIDSTQGRFRQRVAWSPPEYMQMCAGNGRWGMGGRVGRKLNG